MARTCIVVSSREHGQVLLTLASRQGRFVLAATTLSAGAVFLDGTIINVAASRIQEDLGASFATIQWILDAYLLTLGALVLVGGAIGDLFGRRRIYLIGIVGFTGASVLCGLAPNDTTLVLARGLQGIFAAIVAPGGLAILNSSFEDSERGRAIGLWTGFGAVAAGLGPFIGGLLVDSSAAGWRWAFLINVPIMGLAYVMGARTIPHTPGFLDRTHPIARQLDLPGALLVSVSLGLIAYALIEWTRLGLPLALTLLALAAVVLAAFLWNEHRAVMPMMPLDLWRSRIFSVLGVMTFGIYGVLGGWTFLLVLTLQRALGYSALEAGMALIPMTIVIALFASKTATLMGRIGGRPLLVGGSVLGATAMLLQLLVVPGASYWLGVFPGVIVWSIGLVMIVPPITAMTLAAAPRSRAGIASGISNANARVAGLVAVAVFPLIAGIADTAFPNPDELVAGFHVTVIVSAVICAACAGLGIVGLKVAGTSPELVRAE